MEPPSLLFDLPSEIVLHICSFITIPALIPLAGASKACTSLVVHILRDRQRTAALLRNQSLCYHLYQPIDRFGVPLVRCITRSEYPITSPFSAHDPKAGPSRGRVEDLGALHENYTHLLPSTAFTSVLFRDGRGALKNERGDVLSERKVQWDGDELFAQLVYKFEIIQYDAQDGGRCCGSSVLIDGIVRVYKPQLEQVIEIQKGPTKSGLLDLHENKHVRLVVSVRRVQASRRAPMPTYYIKVHGKPESSHVIQSPFFVTETDISP